MQIEREPNLIRFSLESKDWRYRDVRGFLNALKREIPAAARTYDPESQEWEIDAGYEQTFEDLREEYFADKNQGKLF